MHCTERRSSATASEERKALRSDSVTHFCHFGFDSCSHDFSFLHFTYWTGRHQREDNAQQSDGHCEPLISCVPKRCYMLLH